MCLSQPKAPKPPKRAPEAPRLPNAGESLLGRNSERARRRASTGNGTIFTSPLGVAGLQAGQPQYQGATLLSGSK